MNLFKNILQYNGNLISNFKIGKFANVIHTTNFMDKLIIEKKT